MDIFAELRDAVASYDDWPTPEKRADVIDLARRFVGAVNQQAEVIEHMRQTVTPSEQALSAILNHADR